MYANQPVLLSLQDYSSICLLLGASLITNFILLFIIAERASRSQTYGTRNLSHSRPDLQRTPTEVSNADSN